MPADSPPGSGAGGKGSCDATVPLGGGATVACSAATGTQLRAGSYNIGVPGSVAVSPDRTTVRVSGGYGTVACSAATGSQLG